MKNILVIGAGKIGSLIAFLLANTQEYHVFLADLHFEKRIDIKHIVEKSPGVQTTLFDIEDEAKSHQFLQENSVHAIISCLPYFHNETAAKLARAFNIHYFDLTEDTKVADTVLSLSQGATSALVPQCGLAPGYISIVANHLMRHFMTLDTVKMRVGALPSHISNGLQYSLTWSTDGLINEYGNRCHAIEDGHEVLALPLEDLEEIDIDGATYEAFNTSGGIGSLAKTYFGQVKHMSYKTIRYPGHCAKIRFLMNDLKLNNDRTTLKRILENALPRTLQDVVIVYVSVSGQQNNAFMEENYVKKFYPKTINGLTFTAIQLTTASSLCAVVDIVLAQPEKYIGLVRQEQFSLDDIIGNRFGNYFA